MLVRLYAHCAKASFLHKFAQALPSGYQGALKISSIERSIRMRFIILALVFGVAGCAQMIPARSTELSPGRYSLQASGNMFADYESLSAKIDKKAGKLCGEAAYEYETNNLQHKTQNTYAQGMTISAGYKVLTKIASCKK